MRSAASSIVPWPPAGQRRTTHVRKPAKYVPQDDRRTTLRRPANMAIMGRCMAAMESGTGEKLAIAIVALALRDGPASGNAVLRGIPDADLDSPNLPDAGRPRRVRVRDRLRAGSLLALAVALYGASDLQRTHPAHRQSRHRLPLRSHGSGVLVARRRMAELHPRADGARAGAERAPVHGMRGSSGDLRG